MRAFPLALCLCVAASAAQAQSALVTSQIATAFLPILDNSGNIKSPSHSVIGVATLAVGTATVTLTNAAVFSGASTYTCTASDQNLTATLSTIRNVSGSSFTIYGTLTDTVAYSCTGW